MRCVFLLPATGVGEDVSNLRLQVQERMDVKDRHRDFQFSFGEEGDGDQVPCRISDSRYPTAELDICSPQRSQHGKKFVQASHVHGKLSHDHI